MFLMKLMEKHEYVYLSPQQTKKKTTNQHIFNRTPSLTFTHNNFDANLNLWNEKRKKKTEMVKVESRSE